MLRHRSNRGYGAALKTGIASASNGCVVITDADALPAIFLSCSLNCSARRVRTSVRIPLVRRPAKAALNFVANYMTRAKIPDLNSGLRAFGRDMVMQYFRSVQLDNHNHACDALRQVCRFVCPD